MPDDPQPRPRRWDARRILVALGLAAILVLGFALRAERASNPGLVRQVDERSYGGLALSLSVGNGYEVPGSEDPWRWAPGAPFLFAVVHRLAPGSDGGSTLDDLRAPYWANAVAGSLLIVVIFLLAAGLAGPAAGLGAALVVATYPALVDFTGALSTEVLGALVIALSALLVVRAWRGPTWWAIALAGAATGLALLVRADLILYPAILAIAWALLARGREGGRRALAQAAVLGGCAVAAITPWVAYASVTSGRVIPVAASGGVTLFVGTYLPGDGKLSGLREAYVDEAREDFPLATRNVGDRSVPGELVLRSYMFRRYPDLPRSTQLGDAAMRPLLNREIRRNLRTYAVGQPVDFAAMEAKKLWRLWGIPSLGGRVGVTGDRDGLRAYHVALVFLSFAGLFAGIALVPRRRAELILLLLPVLTVTAMNTIFVAQPRHALRVLPVLVAGGIGGGVLAVRELGRRRAGEQAHRPEPAADMGT